MGNFVYQGDEDSCGLAVLKMLLLELTKKKGYRYLTVDQSGPLSLEDIRRAAFKEGVEITWKRCQGKEDLLSCSSKDLPLLIVLEKGSKSHLVYLKKARKNKFLVYDPALGPKWIKKSELIEDFSLIYGEAQLFSEESCPYIKPKIMNKFGLFLTTGISFLGIVSLYLGLSFMGQDESYYLVVLFMAVYGLCSVLSRIVNDYFSQKFDKKWLRYVPSGTKKKLVKNYERYYAFKSGMFPLTINMLESVSAIVGLSFLFGLNDPYFFVSAIGLAFYLAFESKFYRKNISKKKEEIIIDEADLLEGRDTQKSQLRKMKQIGKKANQVGTSSTYARIIYVAMVAALSVIPPIMSGNFSLNYYLFHFFGLVAIGQGIRSLLYLFENRTERERSYIYFIENFVSKENSR